MPLETAITILWIGAATVVLLAWLLAIAMYPESKIARVFTWAPLAVLITFLLATVLQAAFVVISHWVRG